MLRCTYTGALIARHNAIRDVLALRLQTAPGVQAVEIEQEVVGGQNPRMDLVIRTNTSVYLLDVTVCSPTAAGAMANGAAHRPGAAAEIAAKAKSRQNLGLRGFVPLALETGGRAGLEFQALLRTLAPTDADRGPWLQRAWQAIMGVLQQANARTLVAARTMLSAHPGLRDDQDVEMHA